MANCMDEAAKKLAEELAKAQEAIRRAVETDPLLAKKYHSLGELMKRKWIKIEKSGRSWSYKMYEQIYKDAAEWSSPFTDQGGGPTFTFDWGSRDSGGDIHSPGCFDDAIKEANNYRFRFYEGGTKSGKSRRYAEAYGWLNWKLTKALPPTRKAIWQNYLDKKKAWVEQKTVTAQANFGLLNLKRNV